MLGGLLVGAGLGVQLVACLSHVADRGGGEGGYGRMFAWESAGTFMGLFVGIGASVLLGFRTVFAVVAGICAVVSFPLWRTAREAPSAPFRGGAGVLRWPLLQATLTAFGQEAFMLAAMLRLQRTEGLGVLAVAGVLFPGLVTFTVAGGWSAALTRRMPRSAVFGLAYAMIGVGLVLSSFWRGPVGVGVGWLVIAVGIAVIIPLQRAVIAGTEGPLGRSLGRYGVVTILGGALGSVVAGRSYDALPWPWFCWGFAVLFAVMATIAAISAKQQM